ncbi:MAG TPA: porin [Longimicrobiales bacterium]|nr:porin [Longimicrobiales bacterium]
MQTRPAAAALFVLLAVATPGLAQDLRLTGQLRPRFEQRDPPVPAPPQGDVTMRARLGVIGDLAEDVGLRIELQDVLIWGATAGTPGYSAAAEVHQAFVDVRALAGGLTARLGRQEMAIGNQRLISNNNWGQRGRRFEGLRLLRPAAPFPASAFAMRMSESGSGDGVDAWFHGAQAALGLQPGDTVHFFLLYNRERGPTRTDQFTMGGHGGVTLSGIGLSVEGYLQRGERVDRSVKAWLASVGAGRRFGPGRVRLAYDHYSGDGSPDDGTTRAFDRLFGSNHGFHGYADLFTSIPANTGQRGLGDLMIRTDVRLAPRTGLEVNAHSFRAVAAVPDGSKRFGEEIDVVLRHRVRAAVTLEAGTSYFRPGPAITTVRGLDRDLFFGYLMTTVVF